MAFNGNFTASQSIDGLSLTIVDTSVGADANITTRRVYLNLSDGSTLKPQGTSTDYIVWAVGAGPLVLPLLTKDYSININVQWISSSPLPPPSEYSVFELKTFTNNIMLFYYSLTQLQAQNQQLTNYVGYFDNKVKLLVFINDATNATVYNNQFLAQKSLDRASELQTNANVYF